LKFRQSDQDPDQGSSAADFQGESFRRSYCQFSRQMRRRARPKVSPRLEKSLRQLADGEKMIEFAENL